MKAYRGYKHFHTDEALARWAQMPLKQKLRWLDEANAFLRRFMSPEARAIMEQFRRGEL